MSDVKRRLFQSREGFQAEHFAQMCVGFDEYGETVFQSAPSSGHKRGYEDTRQLIASWNACLGIPVDILEQSPTSLNELIHLYLRQRDVLMAAMRITHRKIKPYANKSAEWQTLISIIEDALHEVEESSATYDLSIANRA